MSRTTLRVICILGLAFSAATLILLIPPLFDSGNQGNPWIMGALAVLALVCAAGGLLLRPSTREGKQ
ncbi:MAG: hypothetical protein ACTHWA_12020 [Arachnia sp.]